MRPGFSRTSSTSTRASGRISAATTRNAALDGSPGTSMSNGVSAAGPSTDTASPSRATGTPKQGSSRSV